MYKGVAQYTCPPGTSLPCSLSLLFKHPPSPLPQLQTFVYLHVTLLPVIPLQSALSCTVIENRIYIRGEFKESLGMNFFSPFQPEMEFKVYKSCKCSQIICSRVQ